MGTFEKTIRMLREEGSPVGDVCDDILFDPRFPKGQSNTLIQEYLEQYKERFPVLEAEINHILSQV